MVQYMFRVALIFLLLQTVSQAQEIQPTTFYIVRHAERAGTEDALTEAGIQRAQELATLMKSLRISAIYSTETHRTQSTAKPSAEALELNVDSYGELNESWFEQLKEKHEGQNVLIVGHSNTSGMIVKGLGGEGDFSIDENEYDNLFVVTISEGNPKAIRIRWGNRSSSDR